MPTLPPSTRIDPPARASATVGWLSQRFELSRGGADHNMRSMEGLRGFAVALVFLVHYVTLVDPWIDGLPALRTFAAGLHTIGNTGVDLFFVLSGYLIYGTLIARPQPYLRYMRRRVQRLYPAFLVVFATYVALSLAMPSPGKIPPGFAAAALYLLQNLLMLPGLFPIEPLITVAWSLSYEMFYYLVVPLAIAAFALRRRTGRWRIGLFVAVAVVVLLSVGAIGSHVRLVMFVGGILLWELLSQGRLRPRGSGVAALALTAALLGTLAPIDGPAGYAAKVSLLMVGFMILCHTCFARPDAALPRHFVWTPLRWLGNMSYSYYLLHGLALKAAFLVLSSVHAPTGREPWLFFALLPCMFVLTLLPAAALFLWVERPFSLAAGRAPRARVAVRESDLSRSVEPGAR